jgi:hypothetical protein
LNAQARKRWESERFSMQCASMDQREPRLGRRPALPIWAMSCGSKGKAESQSVSVTGVTRPPLDVWT